MKNTQYGTLDILASKLSRGKPRTYGIITLDDGSQDFIFLGNRMKIQYLNIRHGSEHWNNSTFNGALIMRPGKDAFSGEFILGDANWDPICSSDDPYGDIQCTALIAPPDFEKNTGNTGLASAAPLCFKAFFAPNRSAAYLGQDDALANILLWECQELEQVPISREENRHENDNN